MVESLPPGIGLLALGRHRLKDLEGDEGLTQLVIDDLPAELDREHRRRLAEYLATIPTQVFLTSTDLTQIDLAPWPSARTFHVERGTLRESRNT